MTSPTHDAEARPVTTWVDEVSGAVRRARRRVILSVLVPSLLCVACVGGVTLSLLDGLFGKDTTVANAAGGCGNGLPIDLNGKLPSIATLGDDQVHNAAVIVKTGQDMKVAPRGWVIGVATALQESALTNLPNLGPNNDHDSIGLFQQRPSQGWGTPLQLADPAYQSRKFFEKLLTIPNWQNLPLTVAAQRVQLSAFPDAYAKHEAFASQIVDILTGGASRAIGNEVVLTCASGSQVAASGWTVPVVGPIVSGFRTPDRPTHNGVDIAVPKGTPIHAAASGTVLVSMCDAFLNGQSYSCDRDGSPAVLGCGWYVDILHADNVITRYCHQEIHPYVQVGDRVAAGQIIGLSGASGNASGPHLHFEVHLQGDQSSAGAIDPVPFMNQVGAPIVKPAA
jgi:murein DD-endopeptidase MepM/ murein hydrolase activator NlpD